jgi:hypothetical protein
LASFWIISIEDSCSKSGAEDDFFLGPPENSKQDKQQYFFLEVFISLVPIFLQEFILLLFFPFAQ